MPPKLNKPIADISQVVHYWKGEPKSGKAMLNGTGVLTPNGPKNIESFIPGDKICNTYGGISTVTGVFPQGKRKVAKVYFYNGQQEIVDLDHLWSITEVLDVVNEDGSYNEEESSRDVLTLTTAEIKTRMEADEDKMYLLPAYQPIYFEDREVPLEPLILANSIFTDEKLDDLEYGVLMSVLDESYSIPKEYIFNSLAKRIDFVCGILANAKVDEENEESGVLRVPLKDWHDNIAEEVVCMLRTIGWDAEIADGYMDIEINLVHFSYFMVDYLFERIEKEKLLRIIEKGYANFKSNAILAIEELDEEMECTCIKVDSLDSLYITEKFVVTHNTTLFRDLVLEEYGDPMKGLLVVFGNEMGHLSIDNVLYEEIREWDKEPDDEDDSRGFVQLVDEIVESEDNCGYEMICFDTYSRMIGVCEEYIINKWNIENPNKMHNSIKGVHGGYQEGLYQARDEIERQFSRLARKGLYPVFIGHVRKRAEKDDLTDDSYGRYKSDLNSIYENWLTTLSHINMVIVKEKEIENERLVGVNSTMYFYDDGFVDAGTRFPGMPEKMPLSATNYLEAFQMGVDASRKSPTGNQLQDDAKAKRQQKSVAEKERFASKLQKFKADSAELLKNKDLAKKDFVNILRENGASKIEDIKDMSQLKAIESSIGLMVNGMDEVDEETE